MPSEDLKSYATSDTDFYELLGLTFENSQKDLDRAWRKTALKYHPDKVKPTDTEAKEKFHLAQIGFDLLSDPTTKALYDNTRTARSQKKRQNELFEGKRRQMKDDLEARERGVKRARDEDLENEEKLVRELRRLAEDGKRRRQEREDALKKDVQREAEEGEQENPKSPAKDSLNQSSGNLKEQSGVSELDRTVKVRWLRAERGELIGQDEIVKLFSTFGKIESAHLLNPKMLRMGKKNKKQLASVCMIQYVSVVGAHEAVEDFPRKRGLEWTIFDSVTWAANKEPEFISGYRSSGSDASSAPSTPAHNAPRTSGAAFLNMGSRPSTPAGQTNGDGLRKMPSFSSFISTPNGSPFGKSLAVKSPSLEEMTMIRLKNAEKKRLADEIQRQDEEATAVEAVNGQV